MDPCCSPTTDSPTFTFSTQSNSNSLPTAAKRATVNNEWDRSQCTSCDCVESSPACLTSANNNPDCHHIQSHNPQIYPTSSSASIKAAPKSPANPKSSRIHSNLICIRCTGLLREPLLTPCCARKFCSSCLLPDIVSRKTCPYCLAFPVDLQRLYIPTDEDSFSKLGSIEEILEEPGFQSTMRIPTGKKLKDKNVFGINSYVERKSDQQLFNEGVVMMTKSQDDYPIKEADAGGHDCLGHLSSENVRNMLCSRSQHDCISHVTKLIQGLQMRVASLETELKTRHSKHSKREKSLLSKMATMQNETQVQAVQYQQKINQLTSQLYFVHAGPPVAENCDHVEKEKVEEVEERLEVVLQRDENGSFGFNISGGRRDDVFSCPIFVSKISGQSIQGSPDHSPLPQALSQLQVNDQILKVDEKDLSDVTHEEAVQVIKQSCDPVKFTILRHVLPQNFSFKAFDPNEGHKENQKKVSKAKEMCTAACQTDPYMSFLSTADWCSGDLPPLQSLIDDPELWGSMTDIENITCETNFDDAMSTTDDVIANLFQLNNYDFEYEEVVLKKSSVEEKLGITVCKGAPTTAFSHMFISKIEEGSLAAKDGRVLVGDQIVRINGNDIGENSDVGQLFENGDDELAITLIISRPLFSAKPSIFDLCELQQHLLDDLTANQMVESNSSSNDVRSDNFDNIYEEPQVQDIDETSRDENSEISAKQSSLYMDKDSGLDCDSSTRNDSHSETGDHDRTRSFTDHSVDLGIYTSGSIFSSENANYPMVSSGTAKRLTQSSLRNVQTTLSKCDSTATIRKSETAEVSCEDISESLNASIDEASLPFSDEENVYENVDHILPNEYVRVNSPPPLPKPNLFNRNSNNLYQNILSSKSRSHKLNPRFDPSVAHPNFDERRAQLDLEFETVKGVTEKSTLKLRKHLKTTEPEEREYASIYSVAPPNTPMKSSNAQEHSRRQREADKSSRSFQEFSKKFSERSKVRRNDSMLSIPSHAKQYRSYLQLVKLHEQQQQHKSLASEWKVKIRPDGSRYIAKVNNTSEVCVSNAAGSERRTNRTKILRDRTEKINKERSSTCLTTDDEAVSELKVGRYWSREERTRQHLVSQEKKLRKQMMEHARNQFLEDNLSQSWHRKKQMTEKAALNADKNKILDTFITIQEIMTHGSSLHSNPLLSVTTV